jgi:hypothetical protein
MSRLPGILPPPQMDYIFTREIRGLIPDTEKGFPSFPADTSINTLYDWQFTANQFFLVATSPLRLTTSNFIFQLNTCGYSAVRLCYCGLAHTSVPFEF